MCGTIQRCSLTRRAFRARLGPRISFLLSPLATTSLALLFGGLFVQVSCAADITHANGVIRFAGSTFVLSFSETNGALVSVTLNGQSGTVFTGGEFGLWSAAFKEGGSINAMAFAANSPGSPFTWSADSTGSTLSLNYSNAQIAVTVTVAERSDGVDFRARARPSLLTVLEFSLPARLRWQPDDVQRLICPLNSNESVGAAFKPDRAAQAPSL